MAETLCDGCAAASAVRTCGAHHSQRAPRPTGVIRCSLTIRGERAPQEEARVSVAEAVAGANSKEVPEGGEPDFSRGAAQWWDRVADVEGSAKVRAGKDSERFMKYLARMDESVDTDAVREKMLKYLDRMDRVENIQDAHENGSSTSTERWRPITLDWTEAQEDKAESERERMMRYLERMERNMWLEVNGTREGRVKDFFRMDEADPKQHLFNDTMAHKGKLETVKARRGPRSSRRWSCGGGSDGGGLARGGRGHRWLG